MANVVLNVNEKEVRLLMRKLQRQSPKELDRALSNTARAGAAYNRRRLAGIIGITQKSIKRTGGAVGLAYGAAYQRRGIFNSLRHFVEVRDRDKKNPVLMSKRFKSRWSPLWEGAKARYYGEYRTFPGTFIPLTPSITQGGVIFKRVGKARKPIRPLYAPRLVPERSRPGYAAEEDAFLITKLKDETVRRLKRLAKTRVRL